MYVRHRGFLAVVTAMIALATACAPSDIGRPVEVTIVAEPAPLATTGLVPPAAIGATPPPAVAAGEGAESSPTPPTNGVPTPVLVGVPAPLLPGTPTPTFTPLPVAGTAEAAARATEEAAVGTPDPEAPEAQALIQQGEQIYAEHCAACHQPGGQGIPGTFPALDENPFVTGEPEPVAEIVVHGRGGMPGFGDRLSDQDIAAVVSYIRQAWGNEAEAVAPQVVVGVR
jgi:cytochrome c6